MNADAPEVFTPEIERRLTVYTQLRSSLIIHDRATLQTLRGAVHTALHFSRTCDEKTGEHIARVAHWLPVCDLTGQERVVALRSGGIKSSNTSSKGSSRPKLCR